jgi:pimeloyl-ACP methyl ester carboxylesterase
MGHFGGDLYGKRRTRNIDGWLLKQPGYDGKWCDKWLQWFTFSIQHVFEDAAAWNLDFRKTVRTLKIPVHFLQGHHDYDTPWPLVKADASKLRAPRNQFVWFEKSSHFPFYEEREKFNAAMIEILNAG